VGKGGIVKDEAAQHSAVRRVRQKVERAGRPDIELMNLYPRNEGTGNFCCARILMKKASIISKQGKPDLGQSCCPGGRLASRSWLRHYG